MTDINPYETPPSFAHTSEPLHPMRQVGRAGVFLLRSLVAALLGMQIGSFVCMALNHNEWMAITVSAGAVLAIVFARRHLLLLFVALWITYFAGMSYSRHRITTFCNSFTLGAPSADLPRLAQQANVDFRAGQQKIGPFYGSAYDLFSMGDFGCRVTYDTEQVLSKSLSTH